MLAQGMIIRAVMKRVSTDAMTSDDVKEFVQGASIKKYYEFGAEASTRWFI